MQGRYYIMMTLWMKLMQEGQDQEGANILLKSCSSMAFWWGFQECIESFQWLWKQREKKWKNKAKLVTKGSASKSRFEDLSLRGSRKINKFIYLFVTRDERIEDSLREGDHVFVPIAKALKKSRRALKDSWKNYDMLYQKRGRQKIMLDLEGARNDHCRISLRLRGSWPLNVVLNWWSLMKSSLQKFDDDRQLIGSLRNLVWIFAL